MINKNDLDDLIGERVECCGVALNRHFESNMIISFHNSSDHYHKLFLELTCDWRIIYQDRIVMTSEVSYPDDFDDTILPASEVIEDNKEVLEAFLNCMNYVNNLQGKKLVKYVHRQNMTEFIFEGGYLFQVFHLWMDLQTEEVFHYRLSSLTYEHEKSNIVDICIR
jgi:hypothetical protein